MEDFSLSPACLDRVAQGDAMAQTLLGVAAIPPATPYRAAGATLCFRRCGAVRGWTGGHGSGSC